MPLVGLEGIERIFENGILKIGVELVVGQRVIDQLISCADRWPVEHWRDDHTSVGRIVIAHQHDRRDDLVGQGVCISPLARAVVCDGSQGTATAGEGPVVHREQLGHDAIEMAIALAPLGARVLDAGDCVC